MSRSKCDKAINHISTLHKQIRSRSRVAISLIAVIHIGSGLLVPMKASLVVLAAAVAAAAALLVSLDPRSDDVPVLEIRERDVELITVDAGGAVGPESLLALAVFAAAAILSLDSRSDVRQLEIRDGDVELIPLLDGAAGPESIVFGDAGDGPYTSVSDGRILKWLPPPERRWVEHSCSVPELLDSCRGSKDTKREQECGRPLGLKFNSKTGELYVADAYLGLGVFLNIVITGDNTGRLLKYDPKENKVEVLVDGLRFPNGLAMSIDGSYLLLAETTTGKILRYWIKTPKASTIEEVAQLPGFPDNIKMSPRGGFWVGLHAKRGKIAEWSISYPWLRKLILKLPAQRIQRITSFLTGFGRQVIALRLSEDGKTIEAMSVHGDVRKLFKSISEVEEKDGNLWIGSVFKNHAAITAFVHPTKPPLSCPDKSSTPDSHTHHREAEKQSKCISLSHHLVRFP
uniref:Strictosidine synthase conserved region domain-containing protein n=1 Tax=Oryza barthii TaxID=65489 RepID=A0A0D3HI24_9ORYZ